jgi:hypothetical protein
MMLLLLMMMMMMMILQVQTRSKEVARKYFIPVSYKQTQTI